MKRILIVLTIALVALSYNVSSAQSFKFGTINSSELMQSLPDIDEVQKTMETYAKELESQLELVQVEYNKKVDEYQKAEATLNDEQKASKVKEIQDEGRKVETQRNEASTKFMAKQEELLTPIREKVSNAIKKVGKDNNFTYIFDGTDLATGGPLALYMDQSKVVDITDMVKKVLNVK